MEYRVIRASSDELYHFGVKGQKWGVRRYENEDGTLTEAGKARYAKAQIDASKYKTAKERLKTVAKSGLRGAVGGTLFAAGSVGAQGYGSLRSSGNFSPSPFVSLAEGYKSVQSRRDTALSAAFGAVGGMAVSAIIQGHQAIKVKRGQNFVKKYEDAFKKTYNFG